MKKVVLQEFVSVDGLASGPNDSVDFVPASNQGDQRFGQRQMEFLDSIDTILLGRVTYDLFAGHWPKDMVIWGSISLAQSLMGEGLIDEYQLIVCPVVLGKGRSLFPEKKGPVTMRLLTTKSFDRGSVLLAYAAAPADAGAPKKR